VSCVWYGQVVWGAIRHTNAGLSKRGARLPSLRRVPRIYCAEREREGERKTNVLVDSNWNVMAHGDAREGKGRRNWRMEWVGSTLHTTSEHGLSNISITTTADGHTSAASGRLNWRPRRFKRTRPFAERRNLVSARVPSHFKRSLHNNKFGRKIKMIHLYNFFF